ncbi:MAG TPA: hypothetical protein VN380_17170 [Thermoanaerobaculia bacterium]|jgi:uncharacterized membrane protein|nr:hypothetical protein [Thermoanaerobaculia bacterium]
MLAFVAMGERDSLEMPSLLLRTGRLLFALSVVASGIYQLVTGLYVNLVPVNPVRLPPAWQPYLFGVLFILIGVGLLVRRTVSAAAIALGVLLLVLFFGFVLPPALAHASTGYVWVDPLMILALISGVSLAVVPRDGSPGSSLDHVFEKTSRFVPLALGAFLAYCGVTHFPYAKYVASLIPPWIPAHMFWTYFAAIALIAGGVGVLVPRTVRLAATLSGIMLFSWVFLVHIPLAISTHTVGEVSRGFQALQDSAVAFMLAGTVRSRQNL